jgi:hypothetical protein
LRDGRTFLHGARGIGASVDGLLKNIYVPPIEEVAV